MTIATLLHFARVMIQNLIHLARICSVVTNTVHPCLAKGLWDCFSLFSLSIINKRWELMQLSICFVIHMLLSLRIISLPSNFLLPLRGIFRESLKNFKVRPHWDVHTKHPIYLATLTSDYIVVKCATTSAEGLSLWSVQYDCTSHTD